MAKKVSATSKSIAAINRRANLIYKLYGENSAEYQLYTAKMVSYDIRINKDGVVQIRDTKANRQSYRKINAWARNIKKTPASVVKRDAERRNRQYHEFIDDLENDSKYGGNFLDRATYEEWLSTFSDYFASCYALATREGFDGRDAMERADDLYWNDEEYTYVWNSFYSAGAFYEYMYAAEEYRDSVWYQQYGLDPETGEPIRNPDFMEDITK